MDPSEVLGALKAPKNLPFVALLLFVDALALGTGGGVVAGGLAFLATLGGIALGVYVAPAPPAAPAAESSAPPVVDLFGRLYALRDQVYEIIPRDEGKTITPDAVSHVTEQLTALRSDAQGKLSGALATEFEASMKLLVQATMADDPDAAEARVQEFDSRAPSLPDFLAMAR